MTREKENEMEHTPLPMPDGARVSLYKSLLAEKGRHRITGAQLMVAMVSRRFWRAVAFVESAVIAALLVSLYFGAV